MTQLCSVAGARSVRGGVESATRRRDDPQSSWRSSPQSTCGPVAPTRSAGAAAVSLALGVGAALGVGRRDPRLTAERATRPP